MVDVSHNMQVVPRRDAATLLPVIQHLHPGTIVHSDKWAAYNQVQQLPNIQQHSTVNHSITFVNPATGTHTQNIESYWNHMKTMFKCMKGVHEDMLTSTLWQCRTLAVILPFGTQLVANVYPFRALVLTWFHIYCSTLLIAYDFNPSSLSRMLAPLYFLIYHSFLITHSYQSP